MARKTYTPQRRDAARAARAEKVEQMHYELTAAASALTKSGEWRRWLEFLGSFHRYSFNNTLLIQVQCPHATQVAGFKAWQAKGRQVRKGEKSIRIFGKPLRLVSETDEATGEKTRKAVPCPPPVVSVFDISQTDPIEGVEQPECLAVALQGDDHAALYERTAAWMTAQGWTVTREQIPGETNGFCTVDGTPASSSTRTCPTPTPQKPSSTRPPTPSFTPTTTAGSPPSPTPRPGSSRPSPSPTSSPGCTTSTPATTASATLPAGAGEKPTRSRPPPSGSKKPCTSSSKPSATTTLRRTPARPAGRLGVAPLR